MTKFVVMAVLHHPHRLGRRDQRRVSPPIDHPRIARKYRERAFLHACQLPQAPDQADPQTLLGSAFEADEVVHEARRIDHRPK